VLNATTLRVFHCSLLLPDKLDDLNLRTELLGGGINDFIQSQDDIDNLKTFTPLPTVDPDELIGRTFLMDAQPDGSQFRARIVKNIEYHDYKLEINKDQIKSLLSTKEDIK
jgi:hypothetical protein